MRRNRTLAPLALFSLLAAAPPATGDELRLDNGDRLTGTVVSLAGGELTFETEWGGTLTVAWGRVAALTSGAPLTVVVDDGSRYRGRAAAGAEAGRLALAGEADEPAAAVELARVAAINPPEPPALTLKGSVSLGLVVSSGNTDSESTYLEAKLVARRPRGRYTAGAALKEAEDNGVRSASRSTLSLGYDRFTSGKWYFNASALFVEDEFQDLDRRTALGLSAGYQVWERPTSALSVELGGSYVDEDFITTPDDSYPAARWALRFDHRLAGGGITAFHLQEGYLSLEDSDDLLLRTESGLRFSLFSRLVATTQLNYDYDRSPAPGRERADRTYLATLGLEW